MKFFFSYLLAFVLGAFLTLIVCKYASSIWGYNEISRAQEATMRQVYRSYNAGLYKEAALLTRNANLIGQLSEDEWNLDFPFHAMIFKATGASGIVKAGDLYNVHLMAYLYKIAGDDADANIYYEILKERTGMSKDRVDKSAKAFLDVTTESIEKNGKDQSKELQASKSPNSRQTN